MNEYLNTLFITTEPSYARLEGSTICVEIDGQKKLQVPLHHLSAVVCFGDVMLTPAIMRRCAEDGRSLVLLDRHGNFRARLEGPVSGNVLLRIAQHKLAGGDEQKLLMAQAFLVGKLRNSRQLILRAARDSKEDPAITALDRCCDLIAQGVKKLEQADNLDQIRGIEGDAAKNYFACMKFLIRADRRDAFEMKERSRRPPLDRINALLSFVYTILLNDCRSALEGVGLDPQIGFLHAVRPGKPALALDFMEEFRSFIADRLVVSLINMGQINEKDFEERTGGAVYLNNTGRRTVLAAYQKRKEDELTHTLLDKKVPIGLLPHVQARLLARTIRGDPLCQHEVRRIWLRV